MRNLLQAMRSIAYYVPWALVVAMLVAPGALVLVVRAHMPQQPFTCGLSDAQVHLSGMIPGKGGCRTVIGDGYRVTEYFILAQKSGSHFSLDASVASQSLGVAVEYDVEAAGRSSLVAVFVPSRGDIYVEASDADDLQVIPQAIVVVTGGKGSNLNSSIVQQLTGVPFVAATYPVGSGIPEYATQLAALQGAVGQ